MCEASIKLPNHLAIIMDGNNRWAKKRKLPRLSGHRRAVVTVRNVIKYCRSLNIPHLSLFAFSSENWYRSKSEVNGLMRLLYRALLSEIDSLKDNDIKLLIIGDKKKLTARLQNAISKAEEMTQSCQSMCLYVAINYGGKWDILEASKLLIHDSNLGRLSPDQLNVDDFRARLPSGVIPDVDLLIRTSGEQRLSNFLLWQLAYSELYFTTTLWPDFEEEDLKAALDFYSQRERRFGQLT